MVYLGFYWLSRYMWRGISYFYYCIGDASSIFLNLVLFCIIGYLPFSMGYFSTLRLYWYALDHINTGGGSSFSYYFKWDKSIIAYKKKLSCSYCVEFLTLFLLLCYNALIEWIAYLSRDRINCWVTWFYLQIKLWACCSVGYLTQ